MIGTKLAHYEITQHLGTGGMGEVYQATDTKLGRRVAIKVLLPAFAADAERVARFGREAQVVASLNHPNIASIYGLEDVENVKALVLELVEGPTLADRMAAGPIGLDEALEIARQCAEALEAAHEHGIVHRDFKPANIKIRPDGTVKVLDFGLAKAMEPAAASGSASMAPTMSPTLSIQGTQAGVILGTAAYMSPEQAAGKPVDKRADIWAFGVVLWEMVTGRRMFEGETISHVLAEVLTRPPDLSVIPGKLRPLLRRCLEKDPRKRLRDIGDAMSIIQEADQASTSPKRVSRQWRGAVGWAAAVLLSIALAAVLWLRPRTAAPPNPAVVRFQIERAVDVYNRTASSFAVSPDGRLLAYFGEGADGPQTLLVRTLATGEVHAVPNSAAVPSRDSIFWSSDSRFLVRGSASGTQAFDMVAGSMRPLCNCRWNGGSWSREGVLLLGGLGVGQGISRSTLENREPIPVTRPDASEGEQDLWPVFLPDGQRFLFTRRTREGGVATFLASLNDGTPRKIAEGSARAVVPAVDGGGLYLLSIDASGAVAQRLGPDTLKLTGSPMIVAAGAASVSASENGVLAASRAGNRPRTVPTWFDRKGTSLGQAGEAGFIDALALSPDGRKLLISTYAGTEGGGNTAWLWDLVGGSRSRLPNKASTVVWSADGRKIAYTSGGLFQRAADGTGGETPLVSGEGGNAWANDWSDRVILYSKPRADRTIGNDLWSVAAGVDAKPAPYLMTDAIEQQAQLSPDGRFVAYGSDQSGVWEIYVQPFPNASEGKWVVSSDGGVEPRWSRDGKELFYFSGQTLMAVPVSMTPTFSRGAPVALFDAPIQPGYTSDSHRWQLAPDSKRFLLLVNTGNDKGTPLDVITNWLPLLKK